MGDDRDGFGPNGRILDEIIEFLRQMEWPAEVLSPKVVRTSYAGEFGANEVMIYIGTKDICMVIDPVVDRVSGGWGRAVVRLVTAMSEEIRHINIGLDDDGDIFVKVNLPIAHANLERFHCLLLGLCQVSENMLLPLLQANAFDHLRAD